MPLVHIWQQNATNNGNLTQALTFGPENIMRIAVVGATGMVGQEVLKVLEESALPVTELLPIASERSTGKSARFKQENIEIITDIDAALARKPDYAIFSAGGSTSLQLAPLFASTGCRVIDNSSAWRMQQGIPLVVPEVNPHALNPADRIIANPNCSTIQLVCALWPLHNAFGLKRVIVSTYQSVTGSGQKGVHQLQSERAGNPDIDPYYPHQIDMNLIPHIDTFEASGYTREEEKVINETRKILGLPALRITCTAVRVPVMGGHSESVNVELEKPASAAQIRQALSDFPGVIVQDNPSENFYPMPVKAHGRNEVFIGRIRPDNSAENAFNMWIVADNLRKGAATNAVQIVELLHSQQG